MGHIQDLLAELSELGENSKIGLSVAIWSRNSEQRMHSVSHATTSTYMSTRGPSIWSIQMKIFHSHLFILWASAVQDSYSQTLKLASYII